MTDILIVPGLYNSGPDHWQSRWQARLPDAMRVEQDDWEQPNLVGWTGNLARAIAARKGDAVAVGHSLGVATIVHVAASGYLLHGALLVAPSDLERPGRPEQIAGFAPMPMFKLPFPSIVVTSSNDPHVSAARAAEFAAAWGSRLVDIGPAGHISGDDGFGAWPEGLGLLRELLERDDRRQNRREV
jgi:predicted alpha/beta hydrolase family esterase